MDNEYLSIMEFADLAGVSITDLFGEVLRGDLDGFYKEVDRNTYISIQALERYQKPAEPEAEEDPTEEPRQEYHETPIEDYTEGDIDESDSQEYDGDENRQRYLVEQCKEQSAMIRHLLGELRKADQKIAERDETIHRLSLELAEMATKSHELTEKALTTINQQQILTVMATKKIPWYKRLLGGKEKE